MTRGTRFWISMTVFQVAFGLSVFALTRQYYIDEPGDVGADSRAARQPSTAWPAQSEESDLARSIESFTSRPVAQDPVAISNHADQLFASGQYGEAAHLYEQVLASGSGDVSTYNNLGITLSYLGRLDEALRLLNEGVGLDPSYQRIWLTLGFVNSQAGNIEQARSALSTAIEMGADTEVGQSAVQMLDGLP